MRLALVIPVLLALSGCVTIGAYPSGYYPQGYATRTLVGYDEWGRPVEAVVVQRPVVVYSVPVYGYGSDRHEHRRRGHSHGY